MHNKSISKLIIRVMVAFLLCSNLSIMASGTIHAKVHSLSVKDQGELWVDELANQPDFESWKEAELTVSPLGPGTHSWLMLIQHSKLGTIGYMVIHSDGKGGYVLGEYGLGSDDSLQYLSTNRYKLRYYDPLHMVVSQQVNNTNQYFEPFTSEQYDLGSKHLIAAKVSTQKQIRHGIAFSHALLTGYEYQSYFAPYDVMPWLTTTALNSEFEDDTSIENLIEFGSQLRYTSSIWSDQVEAIYSVTGYHEWELFDLYIELQQDDENMRRFIPFDYLLQQGNFYKPQ
ncbi:hypothetical protein [Paenibacillus endoradicis]|uniref:hypothetical protein n=1 Tax=Paenibacillus endoradicis TaxID=2972487 RepID=UPI00215905BD|nr:hypothetical protein [Paenibacillus endoradicis]MCR8655894.1 hypothetical protein [Paenibacillus endoradicis]MCR8658220.1 hypothetical protein [Paenibacillus endoradicis]